MASRLEDAYESPSNDSQRERMELTCPICLEEFEEPKILPSCKHNVCKHCLQNMTKRKSKALCPVCRTEFSLGTQGVVDLVTNVELAELVRCSREERERQGVARIFELCVQKMADANKLLEDHKIFSQRRQQYGEELQEQIHNLAEKFISCVREKEKELCKKVENEIERHEYESNKQIENLAQLVEESSATIIKIESVLNNQDEATNEDRKNIVLESQKILNTKRYENLTPFDVVTANFSPNLSLLGKLEKDGFGKVYSTNQYRYTGNETHSNKQSSIKPLEAYITVTADDLGLEYFAPLSLATDGKKYVAVADPANSNVLLLDINGKLLKRFKPPGKNPEPLTFSGVAFTPSSELLAVCGSTEVFYLNIKEGGFKMTYRTNEKYGVRYCFVTVGPDGRVLLTCEPSLRHFRSCIFMYKDIPFGKPDLMFGLNGYDHRLEFPFKAIYYKEEYFVSDMEKGSILVYNSQGVYRRQIGGKDDDSLSHIEGGTSHQLVLPTGLALCPDKGCFYICDWGSSSVQVYKTDGTFVAKFTIEGRPTDIILLDSGSVVISSKDDQWIKFYTFPTFSLK